MFQVVIYYYSVSELLNTMPRGTIIVLYTELRMLLIINSACGFMFGKKDGQPSNTTIRPLMAILWAPVVVSPVVPKPLIDILSVLVVVDPVIPKHLMAVLLEVGPVVPKRLMDILSALVVGRPSGTKASDGY